MDRKLIEAVAEALRESDANLYNDVETFDYYEVKAEAAIGAYDAYLTRPRQRRHYVEGVMWA